MRRFIEEEVWRGGEDAGFPAACAGALLRLPEALYAACTAIRNSAYDHGIARPLTAPVPIISIGGIEAGGVGKTPLAIEIARLAASAGLTPAILTRGYGRRGRDPRGSAIRVMTGADARDWLRYGDEPVLMAEATEMAVWVARRRADAACEAAEAGADLGILDDGLQHRALSRDLEIVCLDARRPLANGRLLPAGPLRENPRRAISRADLIVISDGLPELCAETGRQLRRVLGAPQPILSWRGEPSLQAVQGDPPLPAEAVRLVAGIARPDRLEQALDSLGHPVAARAFFPDHHQFAPGDLDRARQLGPDRSAPFVTTGKDWIRLRTLVTGSGERWAILKRRLRWNEDGAGELLLRNLESLAGRPPACPLEG